MKVFEFVALNSSGKKETGAVKAWKLSGAKKKIQEMGLYLVSIKTGDNAKVRGQKDFSFFEELKNLVFSKPKTYSF